MPSVRQLSITADQIDCKIAEARRRASDALSRVPHLMSDKDLEDVIADIARAKSDIDNWTIVRDAYALKVA